MFSKIKNFFKPMMRTIWVALAGQGIFLVSVITMSPLRMWKEPVVNYNLFYVPILALLAGAFFYRCCTAEKESTGYLYGYFSALFAWPLIGEVPSIPVDKGLITQFSSLNIKLLGGYFYVLAGWVLLKIMWRTGALKKSVCVFFLTFLCVWTFELYMDNYSSRVPIPLMPYIGHAVSIVFAIISLIILRVAKKTSSIEKKTVMGCLLYITFSLVLMGSGQWQTPSKFYIKYEAGHIDHEIQELQEEKAYLEELKRYMIMKGLATRDELEKPATAHEHEHEEKDATEHQ